MYRFDGYKAIITGSSAGLGRSMALKLAEGGADIIVNYARSEAEAEAVAEEAKAFGGDVRLVQADLNTDDGC